jgi:hypothetical protein
MTESSHSDNDDAGAIMAHFKTRTELFPTKKEEQS